MATCKRLLDLYRFPGFVPLSRIHGIFGDPGAVVITLRRRRKKRSAISAAKSIGPFTTSGPAASGTFPAATNASTSPTPYAGSSVGGVGA
jgi:hypothetical protein